MGNHYFKRRYRQKKVRDSAEPPTDGLFTRVCIRCNVEFKAARNARYCDDCKAVRRRELRDQSKQRARDGTARQIGSMDKCALCGEEYRVKAPCQMYCSNDCAATALRVYFAVRHRQKQRKGHPIPYYQK